MLGRAHSSAMCAGGKTCLPAGRGGTHTFKIKTLPVMSSLQRMLLMDISTPRLKSLRILHLEPINLVVFQEPHDI